MAIYHSAVGGSGAERPPSPVSAPRPATAAPHGPPHAVLQFK